MQGVVLWFNELKGYGFISPNDGGGDLFIHHSGIAGTGFKTLTIGDRVQFDIVEGRKGPEASNVRVI